MFCRGVPHHRIPGLHHRQLRQPEYAKEEKKACTFCHAKMVPIKQKMAKNLNDAGNYYKDHNHKLDGYTPKK